MLCLPDDVLGALKNCRDGGVDQGDNHGLHKVTKGYCCVYLVPLHVLFDNDLIRRHAHGKYERGNTLISQVMCHRFVGKQDANSFTVKCDTPYLHNPTLQLLTDRYKGLDVDLLGDFKLFKGYQPGT